jgi:hypothetical protein
VLARYAIVMLPNAILARYVKTTGVDTRQKKQKNCGKGGLKMSGNKINADHFPGRSMAEGIAGIEIKMKEQRIEDIKAQVEELQALTNKAINLLDECDTTVIATECHELLDSYEKAKEKVR